MSMRFSIRTPQRFLDRVARLPVLGPMECVRVEVFSLATTPAIAVSLEAPFVTMCIHHPCYPTMMPDLAWLVSARVAIEAASVLSTLDDDTPVEFITEEYGTQQRWRRGAYEMSLGVCPVAKPNPWIASLVAMWAMPQVARSVVGMPKPVLDYLGYSATAAWTLAEQDPRSLSVRGRGNQRSRPALFSDVGLAVLIDPLPEDGPLWPVSPPESAA